MPEGFSSIADLKVSVDANTEQLKGGLVMAHNLVSRFASEGSTSLSRFDAAVSKVGGGIDVLRGKLGIWLQAAELVIGTLSRARAQGEQLAAMAGKTDEYSKMMAAIDEVTDAVKDGLNAAYEEAIDYLKSYALETAKGATGVKAATDAAKGNAEAVEGQAEATGDLADKTQMATASTGLHVAATKEVAPAAEAAAAATLKQADANTALEASYSDKLIALLGEFAHGFRRLADDSKWSVSTVDAELARLEKAMNAAGENVRQVFADGDSAYTSLFGGDDALRGIEAIAEALDKVARMNERRRAAAKAASEAERAALEAASAEAFDKLLPGLEKEVTALERKAEMYGMAKDEAAAYAVVMRVVDDLTAKGVSLTEEHAEKLGDLITRMRELTKAEDERGKSEAFGKLFPGLEKEVEALQRKAATFGMARDEAAAYAVVMRVVDDLTEKGSSLTEEHAEKLGDLITRVRELTKAEDDRVKAVAFDKLLPGLEKEVEALEHKATAFGMTKAEAAAYAVVMRVVDELTEKGVSLTEEHAEKLGNLAARMRELTQAEDDRIKAKEADRFVQSLEREVRELGRQQAQLGQSTAAVAGLNAEMRFRNQLEDNNIALSDKQRAVTEKMLLVLRQKAQAVADDKKAAADADAQTRQIDGALLALQREAISIRAKTAAMYDLSEAGQVNARIEKELQDLRVKGVPLDDKRIAQIRTEATATVEATRAHEQARQQMAMLQESGRIVASSLEGAFARWTEGAKINVRDMVRSMIADMAQLTFKRGVMDALFGGGGSSGGGMFGSLLGPLFGGARAGGGPVASGRAYLVGEEGPELFMPGASGTIIPNGAIRGGSSGGGVTVHVHNTIDARGAYPESIREINDALARQQAGLPAEVVRVVREAQERGIA